MKCELSCLKQDNEKLSAQVMIMIIMMIMMMMIMMIMIMLGEHQVPGIVRVQPEHHDHWGGGDGGGGRG